MVCSGIALILSVIVIIDFLAHTQKLEQQQKMAEKDIFGFGKYETIHAKFAQELKNKYAAISVLKTIISGVFLALLYI